MDNYQIVERDFLNKINMLCEQYKNDNINDKNVRALYCDKVAQIYSDVNAKENAINFALAKKVFLFDEQMQRDLTITENKMLANEIKEFLKEYNGNSAEIINIKVSLAHTMIEDNKSSQWDDEVYAVWRDVMRDIPGFNEALLKERDYWDSWRKKNFKVEVDSKVSDPAMEFLVYMPILVKTEDSNGIQKRLNNIDVLPQDTFDYLMNDFNAFKLHKYINNFSISSIVLGMEGDNWVFKVSSNQFLDDDKKNEFLDTLKSKISGGWGEAMGGKKVNIQGSCFFVSFDDENAQIVEEIKKKNKIK